MYSFSRELTDISISRWILNVSVSWVLSEKVCRRTNVSPSQAAERENLEDVCKTKSTESEAYPNQPVRTVDRLLNFGGKSVFASRDILELVLRNNVLKVIAVLEALDEVKIWLFIKLSIKSFLSEL